MRAAHLGAGLLSLALFAGSASPSFAQTVPPDDPGLDVCSVIPSSNVWWIVEDERDRSVSCEAEYWIENDDLVYVRAQVYAYGTPDEAQASVAVVDPASETESGLHGDAAKESVVNGALVFEFSRDRFAARLIQISGPEYEVREAARQLDRQIVAVVEQDPTLVQVPDVILPPLDDPAAPTTQPADPTTGAPTTGITRPATTALVPEQLLFTSAAEQQHFVKYVGVTPNQVLAIAREWSSPEQFATAVAGSEEKLQRLAVALENPGTLTQHQIDALSWITMNEILGRLIDRTQQPFSPSLNSSTDAFERLGTNAYNNPEMLEFLRSLSGSLIKKDLTMNGMLPSS